MPVLISDNEILFKTKKSFFSDVANYVNRYMYHHTMFRSFLAEFIKSYNSTPLFEFVSPINKIVVDYHGSEFLDLLAVRENDSGRYWSIAEIDCLFGNTAFPYFNMHRTYRNIIDVDLAYIKQMQSNVEGIEGWVVNLRNWDRIKVKTHWYQTLHRMETFKYEVSRFPVSSVAELIETNEIDDFKPHLTEEQTRLVEELELQIKSDFEVIAAETQRLLADYDTQKGSISDFAKMHNQNLYFPLAIAEVRGKQADYVKFWIAHFKPRYSRDYFGGVY
jgi:hypothetical protein